MRHLPAPLLPPRWAVALLGLLVVLTATPAARAVAPPYLDDEELAQAQAIVVARWDPAAPFEDRSVVEGNVLKHLEWRTQILVDRVVKGEAATGPVWIAVGLGVVWDKNGWIHTGMSTDIGGDVEDVRQPGLWFLNRFEDPAAKAPVWQPHGWQRCVQPLGLEAWFRALGARDRAGAVRAVLAGDAEPAARRALEYAAGGRMPWPEEGGRFEDWLRGERDPSRFRRDLAGAVEEAMRSKHASVRWRAAAVRAHMWRDTAIPLLRALRDDPDPTVRAVAAGLLLGEHDESNWLANPREEPPTEALARDLAAAEPWLAIRVVQRVPDSMDPRLVPALLELMEDGRDAGRGDSAEGVVAFWAQAALDRLAGARFPFDRVAARAAWAEAQAAPEAERSARLAAALGDDGDPLAAERLPADPAAGVVVVRVRNLGRRAVAISPRPAMIRAGGQSGGGSWSMSWAPQAREGDAVQVVIESGASVDLTLAATFEPDPPWPELPGEESRGWWGRLARCITKSRPRPPPPGELTLDFASFAPGVPGAHRWIGILTAAPRPAPPDRR